MDLDSSLQQQAEEMGDARVANIRALSFAIPSKPAMDDWVKKWRNSALEAGGLKVDAADYLLDEDD
ncbi:MAG: hypothetical protein AAFX40_08895, partial [Cyanobacteria bacterium J06639_1]